MPEDTIVLHQTASLTCVMCTKLEGRVIQFEAPEDSFEGNVAVMECPVCHFKLELVIDSYFMA